MYKLLVGHPSKSEVIGRCGVDKKNELLGRTDNVKLIKGQTEYVLVFVTPLNDYIICSGEISNVC